MDSNVSNMVRAPQDIGMREYTLYITRQAQATKAKIYK